MSETDTSAGDHANQTGSVYLVGAGPGDPSLMTRRAGELLRAADAVLLDALAPREIVDEVGDSVELYDVGKRAGRASRSQGEINRLLLDLAREGKVVIRLHGGDPMVFGRGGEELRYLRKHGIQVEVVPGVTAACAVGAATGVPLTDRELASEVTLLTGHEAPGKNADQLDWDCLATCRKTLVIYMGRNRLGEITEELIERGRSPDTPALVVSRASKRDETVVHGTLANIARRCDRVELPTPATGIIGDVAKHQGSAPTSDDGEATGGEPGRSKDESAALPVPASFVADWAFRVGLY